MFVNLSSKDIKFAGENIVNVLLDFVGLSVWPEINSVKQKPADLIMTTTTGIQRNQEDWMRTDEYGCPALEESNNSFIICSEIISLIQRLSKSSLWQDALEASLKAAIIKISKLVEGKDDGDDNDSVPAFIFPCVTGIIFHLSWCQSNKYNCNISFFCKFNSV